MIEDLAPGVAATGGLEAPARIVASGPLAIRFACTDVEVIEMLRIHRQRRNIGKGGYPGLDVAKQAGGRHHEFHKFPALSGLALKAATI